VKLLRPLYERDFALLWMGLTISLIGDGIYMVAIAWQALDMTNSPSGLALVGLAWSASVAVFALAGGLVSDRVERRRVMIAADLVRAAALAVIALLVLSDALQMWQLIALVIVFAAGDAFFGPAMSGLVPELVAPELLVDSSSIEQIVRQGTRRMIGPAIGGVVVAAVGAGSAFAVDAATFLVSATAIFFIRTRSKPREDGGADLLDDARAGIAYVRSQRWLSVTVVSEGLALLLYMGPLMVLLPYLIRTTIMGDAKDFGLVLAADGVGSVIAGVMMSRRGMPLRYITALYVLWGAGTLPLIGIGLATTLAPLLVFSALHGALITAGIVIWATLQRSRVPAEMRGRVSSLDWVVGLAFVPISFALTAPVAAAIGAGTTLILAGAASTLMTIVLYVRYRLWDDEPPLAALSPASTATGAAGAAESEPEPAPAAP
jgi:DHA3 family tetracycline resistance protein-like MFS transporter